MNRSKLIMVTLVLCHGLTSMNSKAQTIEEGVKMYNYQRYETAKRLLAPLAVSNPLANYYLGLSELALENTGVARSIFEKYPDDIANTTGIARVLIINGKLPEAMGILNKTVEKARKKEWMPFKFAADAITYTEGGDPGTAVEWYKKAISLERNGDIYIGLGDAYRKMSGGGGNAMSNYEYADEFPSTQSLANYKMGTLWYAAKNYDSALVKFNKSSALDETNPLPYKALADAYYKIRKYQTSKEKIEKYLELTDKSTDDQIQYANTLFLAKEYPAAIAKVTQLVSKGEGEKRPYMYRVLGYSQFETKDYANALMNMNKLFAKHDPKKIIYTDYIYLGKILLTDTSKVAEAEEAFNKGINMDTTADKVPVFREIAEAAFNAENYATSAKWYKKITETNSPSLENGDFWWTGYMSYYSNDYATAEQMFRTYIDKDSTQLLGHLWLARVTEKVNDKDFKNGAASPYYLKWMGMIKEDDESKKKDLTRAYTYLAMVAYNSGNKQEAKLYTNKLLSVDPENDTASQLIKALEVMK